MGRRTLKSHPLGSFLTHSGTPGWTLLLQPGPICCFPLESSVFWTQMTAVITPAAEGMGGNFLLFYPAIPVGVGQSLPPSPAAGM